MNRPARILPTIIFSQFAGSSVWFAGNAVLPDIQQNWNLPSESVGWITSAVQLGFIIGTLIFAVFAIADRLAASKTFFVSCLFSALATLSITFIVPSLTGLLILRFMAGFFLAGIYRIGMKIAAEWYKEGLGKALGWLVGALVLGTAFPHFIRGVAFDLPWEGILIGISGLAAIGGLAMVVLVGDGPLRQKATRFDPTIMIRIFRNEQFRRSAFGYFGHMWELYSLWAFLPILISSYSGFWQQPLNVSFWSFLVIAMGAAGCIIGGQLSVRVGSAKIAFYMLLTSGICCLLSVFVFSFNPIAFILFVLVWGFSVVGDSPQFSTLNAQTAPVEFVGTALTLVVSVGFGITIVSIELLNYLQSILPVNRIFILLIPGPILGLIAIKPLMQKGL